jgi:hypothetical protein
MPANQTKDLSFFVCRFSRVEDLGFYTGILTSNGAHVPGLDDFTFPVTQGTQQSTNDHSSKVEDDVVEVQATEVVARRRGAKGASHRTKSLIMMKI